MIECFHVNATTRVYGYDKLWELFGFRIKQALFESADKAPGRVEQVKIIGTPVNPTAEPYPSDTTTPVELSDGQHAPWCGCKTCHDWLHARKAEKETL